MQVGMEVKVLSPGMEHGQKKPNGSAESLGRRRWSSRAWRRWSEIEFREIALGL